MKKTVKIKIQSVFERDVRLGINESKKVAFNLMESDFDLFHSAISSNIL